MDSFIPESRMCYVWLWNRGKDELNSPDNDSYMLISPVAGWKRSDACKFSNERKRDFVKLMRALRPGEIAEFEESIKKYFVEGLLTVKGLVGWGPVCPEKTGVEVSTEEIALEPYVYRDSLYHGGLVSLREWLVRNQQLIIGVSWSAEKFHKLW